MLFETMYPLNIKFLIIILLPLLGVACKTPHQEDEHEEDHHGHSGIVMEPLKAEQFGIETETVTAGTFRDAIKTSGVIETATSDIYAVTAKKSGIVALASGVNPGMSVMAGERLGTISSDGVQGGDASQAAKANLEAAKAEYERLKPLYDDGLVTAATFREAERAYKEAEALRGKNIAGGTSAITSPGSGIIQNLYVNSGEYVEVGAAIATVSKNASLMLRADLPAREAKHLGELETANFIPEGSKDVVSLSEVNGKKISGTTNGAAISGYIPVYFSFTGSPLAFPGGYAEVYLLCGERRGVISVPREALVEIQGNKYVYVKEDEDEYEKRLVKTGANDGARIEILEGLSEGEKIVSKGASVIRMAEVSAIAPPAHTHNH